MQSITYRHRSADMGKPWQWLLCIPIIATWPFFHFLGRDWDRFVSFDWIAGDWGAVLGDNPIGWFGPALLCACLVFTGLYWLDSPKRNFLLLDAAGLTRRRLGQMQGQWSWEAVSAFTLEAGRSGRRHVVFTLSEGETIATAGLRMAKSSQVRIQDIYDTPLEEIAAKLNEYRDRALAAAPGGRAIPAGHDQPA